MKTLLALCATAAVLALNPHLGHSKATRQLNVRAVPSGPTERIYVRTGGQSQTLALRQQLLAAGAVRINCFLPDIIVFERPAGVEVDLSAVRVLSNRSDAPSTSNTERWARAAYRLATEPRMLPHSLAAPGDADEREACAVLEVPREVVQRTQQAAVSSPDVRNVSQNSEIMIGTIVVNLIFPESEGGPVNTEDWTDAALTNAQQAAAGGVLYYQLHYPSIDMNFIIRSVERATTTTEPITMVMDDENLWVSNVMAGMGYNGPPSEYLEQVHAFNEESRRSLGADWAFSAFIVNSENDDDHRFEGAPRNAWAYLGGPHFVLPHPVGLPREGEAPPHFGQNFTHQVGHMFWGLDEHHRVLSLSCQSRSGYLNYNHGNYQILGDKSCFGDREECIMNLDDAVIRFYSGPPCVYSAGMFGLVDGNENGVPDAVDLPPALIFESGDVDTVTTREASIRFRAVARGVPNSNSYQDPAERVDYVLPVKLVARSQNGVAIEHLVPLDGAYDELEEEFEYNVTALQSGMNFLRFITRNTARSTSTQITKRIYFLGLTYLHFEFDASSAGVRIRWNLLGSTFNAKIALHRVDPATGEDVIVARDLQPSGPGNPPFAPYEVFDDTPLGPGRLYDYYVSGSFEVDYQGSVQTITSDSDRQRVRGALPIVPDRLLSNVAPNPFNQVTWTSVNVPESFREDTNGNQVLDRTPVAVAVFDVAGRRVKTLVKGAEFAHVLTVGWDGTNRRGEPLPSGVYFIQVAAGALTDTRKVVLVR